MLYGIAVHPTSIALGSLAGTPCNGAGSGSGGTAIIASGSLTACTTGFSLWPGLFVISVIRTSFLVRTAASRYWRGAAILFQLYHINRQQQWKIRLLNQ
jgi:hypothetical protein